MMKQLNVFNESIHECCLNPITGYHRDGFCNYHTSDSGLHLVCALMTETFLSFSRSRGNDLSTPRPEFNFPGLKEGDLKKTHLESLRIIDFDILKEYAIDIS